MTGFYSKFWRRKSQLCLITTDTAYPTQNLLVQRAKWNWNQCEEKSWTIESLMHRSVQKIKPYPIVLAAHSDVPKKILFIDSFSLIGHICSFFKRALLPSNPEDVAANCSLLNKCSTYYHHLRYRSIMTSHRKSSIFSTDIVSSLLIRWTPHTRNSYSVEMGNCYISTTFSIYRINRFGAASGGWPIQTYGCKIIGEGQCHVLDHEHIPINLKHSIFTKIVWGFDATHKKIASQLIMLEHSKK